MPEPCLPMPGTSRLCRRSPPARCRLRSAWKSSGLDLRDPPSAARAAQLQDAWHAGQIILLRHQTLSDDEQVRFAECFGPPAHLLRAKSVHKHPAVMLISNIREDGKPIGALPDGEMHFHTDQCYVEKPAAGSMLYAIEMPSVGGNTLFANAYLAYETLPDEIKRRIDGRKAINAYDYDNASTKRGTKIAEGVPHFSHPVVRTHPATGRKALYVNRLMTVAIEGPAGGRERGAFEFPVRPSGAAPLRL